MATTLDDRLKTWQELARLSGAILDLDDHEARRRCIYDAAIRMFGMDRATLVPIGRAMAELSAPGRNQLPFFEYLALQRKPVLVQDANSDHGFTMPAEIADWRFPTLLFIPLIARETALGVLALASNAIKEFSPEEEALIGAFVPQVVAAMDSETLQRLAARHEAFQAFLGELDGIMLRPELPEILSATVRLVQKALEVEKVLVFSRPKARRQQPLDVTVAEGCPYANGGCLSGHACGKLANSHAGLKSVEIRNAEAIAAEVGPDHALCQERQVAIAPIHTHRQHYGVLQVFNKLDGTDFTQDELDLIENVGRKLGLAFDNHALMEQVNEGSLETIKGLARALDSKDKYTANHSENVAQYGYLTAVAMGLDPEHCQRIKLGGILHDIGKIGIPDEILNKPSRLTDEEFMIIKQHPGKGYRILEPFKQMRDVADAACSHHERYDGAGYPRRLKAEAIPIGGRILALADAFDTLTSDRKYRPRVPIMDALVEMRRCAGSHFDPQVVVGFFLAMAELGPLDLNKNELPPRELLLEMADLSLPLERFLPPKEA
ncbi:HD domain-containing protein [bacterium]|nr:HD domain-containing protein [bacterium]